MRIKRKALTTAELMIALTIIGVIAVLVLPGFIEDYNKKIFLTRLKKTYMALSSAVEQACADSNVSYFKYTPYAANYNKDMTDSFLKKYMNADIDTSGFADKYGTINGNDRDCGISAHAGYSKAMLKDGQAIAMICEAASENCYIFLDVNGKAEPNKEGRDMFSFRITQSNNEISDYQPSDKCLEGKGTIGDSNIGNGSGCLTKIMEDNWQMKY